MSCPATPAQVAPFVRVLGIEGALEFFMNFGGAEIVYARNPVRSRLVEVMGMESALALAQEHATRGLPRRVPLAKPWCSQILREKGLSVAEIARRMRASDVAVRRWLKFSYAAPPQDPRQGTLF